MTPVTTEFVAGEVLDIEPAGDSSVCSPPRIPPRWRQTEWFWRLAMRPPAALPGSETLAGHPAWVGDPWQPLEQRPPGQGGSIVVLGTGLTTVDVIISLRALGWMGSIHAISPVTVGPPTRTFVASNIQIFLRQARTSQSSAWRS